MKKFDYFDYNTLTDKERQNFVNQKPFDYGLIDPVRLSNWEWLERRATLKDEFSTAVSIVLAKEIMTQMSHDIVYSKARQIAYRQDYIEKISFPSSFYLQANALVKKFYIDKDAFFECGRTIV